MMMNSTRTIFTARNLARWAENKAVKTRRRLNMNKKYMMSVSGWQIDNVLLLFSCVTSTEKNVFVSIPLQFSLAHQEIVFAHRRKLILTEHRAADLSDLLINLTNKTHQKKWTLIRCSYLLSPTRLRDICDEINDENCIRCSRWRIKVEQSLIKIPIRGTSSYIALWFLFAQIS